jgi:3-oxoacyl-(acyl-carrier-protein) synthase
VRLAALECLTPFGGAQATHDALLAGRSALRPVPVLGRRGGDAVPLALLPGHALDEEAPPVWLRDLRAFLEPVRDGGWGAPRRPVCFASSNFGVGSLYEYRHTRDPAFLSCSTPERCVAHIRQQLGWGAHGAIFSHACVSAHLALLHASRLLAAGVADEVLVVSFDFVSPFVAGGFHALKILNGAMPAPYQAREIGAIGLGDGAAFAVVSRDRGEFEIAAQAVHNEMHHMTSNEPGGTGFDAVLRSLEVGEEKVWFKGHGTGTLDAGRLECAAVERLLPGAPIVGWKGALGHTLGSCGLVELALAARALRTGRSPGAVNSGDPAFSPQVALAPFDNHGFDGAVCASNAFGGAHAALLLRHV